MDVRGKLVELLRNSPHLDTVKGYKGNDCTFEQGADWLIAHGVTVQEHGYWETVVEVKDNTVCGNGVKIDHKRCSCCKNPAKFFKDDFCGNCGAKLDLPQPLKGETNNA